MLKLNGINVESLNKIFEEIKKEKEKVKELSKWRIRIRWLNAFKSRAYIRRHTLDVDEVSDISGIDTAQNAIETLLASLGSCIITTLVLISTRKGIKIENLEIAIEGNIENPLAFLGLEEGNAGFNLININIYIKAETSEEKINEIIKETMKRSPVVNTITKSVKINYNFKIF